MARNSRLLTDLYHYVLTARWSVLVLTFAAFYLVLNAGFAAIYLCLGDGIANARPGRFDDAFFFSAQTMATVGYGAMHPRGIIANALTTIEAFMGLFGFAMASGLMFAKFSRPTARVLFSKKMVIGKRDGKRCLTFRMANSRSSQIVEAHLSVVMVKTERTKEGDLFRKLTDLSLVRDRSPIFALTWTGIHVIDESSPLWNETPETLKRDYAQILLTLVGIEATFSETVHVRYQYLDGNIDWNHKFVDVLSFDQHKVASVNYEKFHDTVPE